MLIKKTIVLTAEVAVGYVTLIRVGSSVGVKVILNSAPRGSLYLGLKVGVKPQLNMEISSARTEREVELDLSPTDELGAVIVDSDGKIYAVGGRKEAVNGNKILSSFSAREEKESADKIETQKDENPDTVAEVVTQEEVETPDTVAEIEVKAATEPMPDIPDIPDSATVTEAHEDLTGDSIRGSAFPPFSENKGENFYRNIRSKLEEIMTANPREEALEKLIPESKWVKVYYDEDEYYVVGILSEAGEVTFLGYGVPGIDGIKPPKEAEELCDFLAIPGTVGEGYWLMFQNAHNGDMLGAL